MDTQTIIISLSDKDCTIECIKSSPLEKYKRHGYLGHYWKHTVHKWWVFYYGLRFAMKFLYRIIIHDYSKYLPSEAKGFATARNMYGVPYGHPDTKLAGDEIKPTIDLHKTRNSHHPEFYENGINGMDLLDFVEMACDWKAAGRKNADGNFRESLAINQNRYGLTNQCKAILENTKLFN